MYGEVLQRAMQNKRYDGQIFSNEMIQLSAQKTEYESRQCEKMIDEFTGMRKTTFDFNWVAGIHQRSLKQRKV